jgi:integrase/recombinase XerD
MSSLRAAAEDYLQMRRALGYKLRTEGWLLPGFISYLEQLDAKTITIEHALAWATQPADATAGWWAQRLTAVRQFALHLQTIDPACEVPPAQLLPRRPRRAVPYLYTREDIAALITAAGERRAPFTAATYQTLLGLLAVTGLRVGEAIALDRDDVDAEHQLLRIINSKFGKSREVGLHDSTMRALTAYARLRDQSCPRPRCEAFFISRVGTRLRAGTVHRTFKRLVRVVGLEPRSARCRPRVHDLRHSFAVSTLIDWYRAGVDVQTQLPRLSTYMGHTEPSSTYWYLTAAPELLFLAAERLEPTLEGFS